MGKKSNLIPILLIGAGLIFLFPMITGGKNAGNLLNVHHRVTCELVVKAGLISGDRIISKNCARETSVTCGVTTTKSILNREGTIKILMDNGDSVVKSWSLFRGETSKTGILSVCSESTSGKVQLFDNNGNLKDEKPFQVS